MTAPTSRFCWMCGGPTTVITDEPAWRYCNDQNVCGFDERLTPVVVAVAADKQQRRAA